MKRPMMILLVLLVGALAVGGYLLFSDDAETDPAPQAEPTPSPDAEKAPEEVLAEAPELIYLENNVLKSIAPGEDEGTVIREGVSPEAKGPVDASFASWVAFAGAEPRVHVYDREADEVSAFPGTAPHWNEDGSTLAFLQRLDDKMSCDEVGCEGDVFVSVYDPETDRSRSILDQGRFTILGWAGDDLVVGDLSDEEGVLLVDPDGEARRLDVPYEGVKSVSPDGRWVVFAPSDGPELLRIDDEVEAWNLGGPDDTITDVDWASDSSRAVIVATTGELPPRVFTLDVASPSLVPFGEDEVVGDVFWNENETGIVVTKVNREEAQLVASYCSIDAPSSCVSLLEWQSGISVFGVENDS